METNWDGTHIAKLSFCFKYSPIFKLEYFLETVVGEFWYFIFPDSFLFRSDNHLINPENMHFEMVLIWNNWRMEQNGQIKKLHRETQSDEGKSFEYIYSENLMRRFKSLVWKSFSFSHHLCSPVSDSLKKILNTFKILSVSACPSVSQVIQSWVLKGPRDFSSKMNTPYVLSVLSLF